MANPQAPSLLLSTADACDELRLGRTTILKLIDEGRLETVLVGRRKLVVRASVVAFVEGLRREQIGNGAP